MLRKVDLSNAELAAADLEGTRLGEAILTDAQVQDADLTNADLEGANLTGADLTSSILTGADLYRAIVKDADLTTTDLVEADLTNINLWEATLFPSDTTSPTQYKGRQRKIRSIDDLLIETRKLKKHHDSYGEDISFYFRGEPMCGWELKPSVMRGNYIENEGTMLLELMSRRPEEFTQMSSALSQWVLAQHHNLKTRFLDVTKNPMVALFHACERNARVDHNDALLHVFAVPQALIKAYSSDTASIVANFAKLSRIEQDLLLSRDIGPREDTYRPSHQYTDTMDRLGQFIRKGKPYFRNRIDVRDLFRVFVVEPQQLSERLRIQSGAFLVSAFHERFERSMVEQKIPNIHIYAHYTLTIPRGAKCRIRDDLELINIKREILYPGLDESAKAITDQYGHVQNEDIGGEVSKAGG